MEKFRQSRRCQMKLEDPRAGLESLYKSLTGLNIQFHEFHVEFIGESGIVFVEVLLIEWRKKNPIQSKAGHSLLHHCLSADHDEANPGVIQTFQGGKDFQENDPSGNSP